VTVRFDNPGKFTDLSLSGNTARESQDPLLKELEGYFKHLGERYLPQSDTLDIVVENPVGTELSDTARLSRLFPQRPLAL